jgi:hypothetical protein
MHALPVAAQFAPIFGMLTGDYNGDGNEDVLIAGNSYSTEASTGRYDAMTGPLLSGDGKGNFTTVPAAGSGFKADGDVKSLASLVTANGNRLILVGNNSAPMQAYQYYIAGSINITIKEKDVYAVIQKKNGQQYRQEFYYGNNYLSQTTRTLTVDTGVKSVTIYDNQGKGRQPNIKQP